MSTEVEKGDKVSWAWGSSNPSGTASEVKPGEVTVVSHRGNEISKTGTADNPAVHIERSGNDVVKLADELKVTKKADSATGTNGSSSNGTSDKKDAASSSKESGDAHAGDKRKASEPAESAKTKSTTKENGTATEDAKKLKVTNGKAAPPPKEKTPAPKKEKTPAPAKEKAPAPAKKEKTPAPAKKEAVPAPPPAEEKDEEAPPAATSEPAPTEKKKPGRPKGTANSTGAKKEKKVPTVGQAQRKTRSQGAAPEKGL